MLIYHWTNY